MSTMTVEFERTAEDVRESIIHHQRRGKHRKGFVAFILLPLVLVSCSLLATLVEFDSGERDGALIFGGATAAFVFVAVNATVIALTAPSRQTTAALKDEAVRVRVLGLQTVTLAADGIHWTHPVGEGFCAWSGVTRVEKTRTTLYLYMGGSNSIAVPARAFASLQEYESFAVLAGEYLSGSSRA